MDRRSWPWKKKTSEKVVAATDPSTPTLSNSDVNQARQENTKTENYKQITLESYKHFTELEDQVKALRDSLSAAQAEMVTKDDLVKQHAKVAEEAVSGWEKAEAEASALKQQLEYVTLSRLKAEECASHLDGALKECMKQIKNVKEEGKQELHDVVFAKTKQWERIKLEFEDKVADLEQELLRASAENAVLTRSLQESSDCLMKINDDKAQADAEIEVLKTNIQSYEKEVHSLKYELHIVSKELEIRNEEKNMSIRSADVANRQHLEDVKKISKLEAECHRLRCLVRKKLPGPAALAQMKLEVESLGRDHVENLDAKLRHSPVKSSSPQIPATSSPGFDSEHNQNLQKENDFLTARLLSVEEEMKMLKEALSKRNSELQTSRDLYAKAENKLRIMEEQVKHLNEQKNLTKSNIDLSYGSTLNQNGRNPPSMTSTSEDGVDEDRSRSESWATTVISETSQVKKEKTAEVCHKADDSNNLELMDDFLEMEKLACLTSNSNHITSSDMTDKKKTENAVEVDRNEANKDRLKSEKSGNSVCSGKEQFGRESSIGKIDSPLTKLRMRIACVFESEEQNTDTGKVLNSLRDILGERQEEMPQCSISCISEETNVLRTNTTNELDPEFKNAISHIHDVILTFAKEVVNLPSNDYGLKQKMDQFSSYVKEVLENKRSISDFLLDLHKFLSEASEMKLNVFNGKASEGDTGTSDCVDKVTLLENKVPKHQPKKDNISGASTASNSFSHPEAEGLLGEKFESRITELKFSLEEFEELKLEKESIRMELITCSELLEQTQIQLAETEQKLTEMESQLTASQKSNSLFETQLKCMAESYKLLESQAQVLQAEVSELQRKAQTLNNELKEEKRTHQDDLASYRELQELIERRKKCSMCSGGDDGVMTKQERELAAEKLAECQETILLLSKQLQSLHSPEEQSDSSRNSRHHLVKDGLLEDEPGPSGSDPFTQGTYASINLRGKSEMKSTPFFKASTTGGDGDCSYINSTSPESSFRTKFQKHRISKPPSSSASPEKYGLSAGRFLSK